MSFLVAGSGKRKDGTHWHRCVVRVRSLHWYPTFEAMVHECGPARITPGAGGAAGSAAVYHSFPGYSAGAESYGAAALGIEFIDWVD